MEWGGFPGGTGGGTLGGVGTGCAANGGTGGCTSALFAALGGVLGACGVFGSALLLAFFPRVFGSGKTLGTGFALGSGTALSADALGFGAGFGGVVGALSVHFLTPPMGSGGVHSFFSSPGSLFKCLRRSGSLALLK